MTIKDLLVGKKVRVTEDCGRIKKDKIYTIEFTSTSMSIRDRNDFCMHYGMWQLLGTFTYTPPKHKHSFACTDCGEKVKK